MGTVSGSRIRSGITCGLAGASKPCGRATAWKRLSSIGIRWPCGCVTDNVSRSTVQDFISGRPANSMLACWRGEVLSLVSVAVVAAEGPTGAATIVRVIRNESMRRAANWSHPPEAVRLLWIGFHLGIRYRRPLSDRNQSSLYAVGASRAGGRRLSGGCAECGAARQAATTSLTSDSPHEDCAVSTGTCGGRCVPRAHIEESHHDMPSEEPDCRRSNVEIAAAAPVDCSRLPRVQASQAGRTDSIRAARR